MSFMRDFDHLKIQMKDIVTGTNNFDPTKVIGSGGFGSVYKGELSSPEGEITLAFKKLDRRLGQGNIEFWKEIMMLSKYKHENLISLMHFCIEGDEMILAYEYASRGSLDRYLSDAGALTWIRRLKICVGAARGLCFLHDPKETHQRVLHRDVKSANILLDANWTAKVSDFGLSKFGPANQAPSYLVSRAVGTPGYCDPLYWELGFLSKESDVYSFGVVLFEILCGRLCYEYHNCELTKILVPKWRRCYDEKRLDEIILPGLKEQMDPGSLKSFSSIAYKCVKKAREERPTMAKIVEELEYSLEQQEIFENIPESGRGVRTSLMLNGQMVQSLDNDHHPKFESRFQDGADDEYSQNREEDGPGIDGFQIQGDATPGGTLTACGYSVHGTSTCKFQWVRHFEDATWTYIEGAIYPKYLVTADDVDKHIAVECTPKDDQGRQGEVVRLFANEQRKITCDPEMQREIDNYMSAGQASFSASLLIHSSEIWEQTICSLTRSKYEIKSNHTQDVFMDGKYSIDLMIKIPSRRATQFVLTRPNGYSHNFDLHDSRRRDTFVLTMRMFQRKMMVEIGDESSSTSPSTHKSRDGPGIDDFQILGDAKPGSKLLACGFSVNGTSLCMFQWVRHFEDGTWKYIEGGTDPEYVVTADDVDKLISVECIPMDDQGRQGEIVRLFANKQNKITSDPESNST
ncbi:hypothetical protein L1987_02774 [Smallanthus sonchifolius]|uniref:Uncharacterized protein n=1 Tax=Smallanthus sonchifolius TaxID=185202 RepID=A0ACB9K8R4_9ASTR|nr:hypothetical protein L1987_02774 [Smallanthus sonchifolius]